MSEINLRELQTELIRLVNTWPQGYEVELICQLNDWLVEHYTDALDISYVPQTGTYFLVEQQ